MNKEKNQLRQTMQKRIQAFENEYIENADKQIAGHILDSDLYKEATTIFTFITMNREIDVLPIVRQALKDNKTVCAPKCYDGGRMDALKISSLDDMIIGRKDVPEPEESCPLVCKEDIDLILVPCLAADISGYRLGYGGGYYDMYLESYKGNSLLLCREEQLVEEIPVESFDISTGYLVTEASLNLTVPFF